MNNLTETYVMTPNYNHHVETVLSRGCNKTQNYSQPAIAAMYGPHCLVLSGIRKGANEKQKKTDQ